MKQKTHDRKKFTQYFFDNKTPLILLNGYAGVGKTFIALHAALTQVLDQSTHYEKIVIVRSAVESGMSQGFLPGSLCEKNEPYELPYKLLLKKMFKEPNDLHYANLKTLGCIDFLSTTYLRGITLDNTIIIVEEENVLSGIQDYIEYIPLKTFISVSTSNYVDEDGFYLVYIEIEKTESLFDDFVFIVKELSNLTSFDEWTIHVYKKQARKN